MSITLLVRITAKPGHGRVLADILQPVPGDNDIEGCFGMEVFTSTTNSDDVLILEHWSSIEAHKIFLAGVIEQGGLDEITKHAATVSRTYFTEAPG